MPDDTHLSVLETGTRSTTPMQALPENDGMMELRAKLHEIRELALSTEETAKRMHTLMMEAYESRNNDHPLPAAEPDAHTFGTAEEADLTAADLAPTYHPHSHVQEELDETLAGEHAEPILGCRHYMRNVKVQCFDCHMWFPCRHCHDSSPDLPFRHQLNRTKTRRMLCMKCKTPQAASDVCVECGHEAAYYYCNKCKLWDNDSTKRIYHCDDCGICRRGEGLGKDFVHCKRCNVCISISTSSAHPCVERATDCDCPLCLDHLFTSSTPVVSLMCGHYMHASCYKELMNVTYRCPVCSKSAVNMELQWRKLDDEIRLQPMPEEDFAEEDDASVSSAGTADLLETSDSRLAAGLRSLSVTTQPARTGRVPRRVWVGCNDCGGRGWAAFHWLGLKCPVCDGYNTSQMTPTGLNIRQQPTHHLATISLHRHHDFSGAAMLQSFDDPTLSTREIELARSPTRSDMALSPPAGGRSYFLSSSPSSMASPRSWASSLSPTRLTARATSPPSSADSESNEDYLTLLIARLDRFGISPSDFLSRVGISPSEFLTRLNLSTPDFLDRVGISPADVLHRVGRSLSPMRHYLESLDANARDRAAKAGEKMVAMAEAAASGGRWSRRDLQEGRERWEMWRRQMDGRGEEEGGMAFWGGESGEEEGEEEDEEWESDSEDGEGEAEGEDGTDGTRLGRVLEDEFEIFGHR